LPIKIHVAISTEQVSKDHTGENQLFTTAADLCYYIVAQRLHNVD